MHRCLLCFICHTADSGAYLRSREVDMFYAGIGSRSTPPQVLVVMTQIAAGLEMAGYTLRSGGADGADTAFATGCSRKVIYRPHHATDEALQLAASVHPAWHCCRSGYVRALHARNCFQVLGDDLATPSDFIVCWTPDGAQTEDECSIRTGGTATAIRLAHRRGIPVINLQRYY